MERSWDWRESFNDLSLADVEYTCSFSDRENNLVSVLAANSAPYNF